jgi:hypothetical protein
VAGTPHPEVPGTTMMSVLAELDQTQAELEKEFPDWRIWYVYRTSGITWAAQREPVLNTRSAEDLRAAILKILGAQQ